MKQPCSNTKKKAKLTPAQFEKEIKAFNPTKQLMVKIPVEFLAEWIGAATALIDALAGIVVENISDAPVKRRKVSRAAAAQKAAQKRQDRYSASPDGQKDRV
jgi:hypothetical protein